MVTGVSQVNVQGGAKYAVRVQVDPDKLEAQKMGINEINTALQNWNVTQPTGQLFGPSATYSILAKGQLNNADEFRQIVVSYRNGRPVRLSQVANVLDSVQNVQQRAWYVTKDSEQRSITLEVQKQPGTNVIEVADAVRAVLPALEKQLPPFGAPRDPAGSFGQHPPGLQRHPVDDAHYARPRRGGHLCVSPQRVGDLHPGSRAAIFDSRHLRRDES